MIPMTANGNETYLQRISELEQELDEMTDELSHAWDQLVPFLKDSPVQTELSHDPKLIIQAAMAAVDTELGGLYLFESDDWFSVPDNVYLQPALRGTLKSDLKADETFQWQTDQLMPFKVTQWLFIPVITDQKVIGAIGVGSHNQQRTYNAADLLIVRRMAERAASQIESTQLARSREREAKTLQEMQIASMIQRSIQPARLPQISGLQMAPFWEPAKDVGGDAWGWIARPDGKLAWFILDVAGKGLPAALAAVSLYAAVRVALRMNLSPTDILNMVNDEFYVTYTNTDLMATAAILMIDPATGTLEVANAGHTPILVRHAGQWLQMNATVPPIGVLPESNPETVILALQTDDLVMCYSDGFTEIETDDGLWGIEGLCACIPDGIHTAGEITKQIVKSARAVSNGREIQDDQTLVVVVCG